MDAQRAMSSRGIVEAVVRGPGARMVAPETLREEGLRRRVTSTIPAFSSKRSVSLTG